jgi:VWFA-related protein
VRRIITFLVTFPAFLTFPAPAQTPEPSRERPTIQTTVDEVLLDLIVRDKKGKPVSDVKPNDVTVTDNGVKQKITGFRLVQGAEALWSDGTRTPLDPLRQIRLVTLAFEAMGDPGQRQLARQAALDLVKGEQGTNVFYSVVVINTQLNLLQPFTRDRDALEKAIALATSGGGVPQFTAESERQRGQLQQRLQQMTGQPELAEALRALDSRPTPAPGSPALGAAALDAKLTEIMLDMTRTDFATTDGALLSLSALQSLVRGLSELPGRKTVLYFTWGLVVPPRLDDQFKNLVSMANRANVTFYGIQANGVMTYSQNGGANNSLAIAARSSAQNATKAGAVDSGMIRASDMAEEATRSNVQLWLRNLAENTGGFLVADSNDLRTPVRKINEEVASYYELSYHPEIQNYDGSYHHVKTEIDRKGLLVQARSGYFALPPELRTSGLLPFEPTLLQALADGAKVREVPVRARLLRFQPNSQGVDTEMVVEVPVQNLQFRPDQAQNWNARLSMLALVKDESGRVVRKFTRDVPITATAENLPAIKEGNFIYKDRMTLPPGKYILEAAVMDRENSKIGAVRGEYVASVHPGLSISDLSIVHSYAPGAKDLDPADPFQYQGGRITPTLSDTVQARKGSTLSMFFVVYPNPASSEKTSVELEYVKDGKVVGKGGLELPPADARGRIPYVMSSSAEALPVGDYVLRALARQGGMTAEETLHFHVEK